MIKKTKKTVYQDQVFIPLFYPTSKSSRLYATDSDLNKLKDITKKDFYVKVWSATNCRLVSVPRDQVTIDSERKLVKTVCEQILKDKESYILTQIHTAKNFFDLEFSVYKLLNGDINYLTRQNLASVCPGALQKFDELHPDKRDVIAGIEHFLKIQMAFKAPGDDDHSKSWFLLPIYSNLKKYGYTEMDGFKQAWILVTNLYKLPGKKFLETNRRTKQKS